jgi:broad specificity phosphatase PhoE/predicted kinase
MSLPRRGRKYLIAMVGLPARGKTFTARKLTGYLSWLGYATRSFNVGERRRQLLGPGQDHDFFDPANADASAQREALSQATLDDAFAWLQSEGRIAIFDATNGTAERRARIRERCTQEDVDLLFVELFEDDPKIIEANVRETKVSSPDYVDSDTRAALHDFRARIAHYEGVYRTLTDEDGSFVRIESRGRTVVIHEVHGWVPGRVVLFLSNLQVTRRPIWLTRHGESAFNQAGRIGGNSPLSSRGRAYAQVLADHVQSHRTELADLDVWTSTLQRTLQTASPICEALALESGEWKALDEIDSGVCDGLTYEEIAERYPSEFEARGHDKLRYRYPGGESYEDVIQRLDRVIVELERYRTPVLVVAHRAVVRALYGYFVQLPPERVPHVDMPLHTIIELTPTAYGCRQEWRELDVPST